MTTIRVTNWERWQTYRKDRGTPPWIKIHRNLMSNPEWAALTDADKGQLVSIWLVAADKGGEITSDAGAMRKICQLDDIPNISKFIQLGFLTTTCQPDDNQMTTTCPQVDAPESETETDNKRQIKALVKTEFDRWWSAYPKKVGKKPTLTIWKRIKPNADLLIADIENRLANDRQWQEGYIPNPQTYLNQERWNDAIQSKQPTESDEYASRVARENALLSKINGSPVGNDGQAVPSNMDEGERRGRLTAVPRLD